MQIIKTQIPDVLIIEPRVFEDSRGFFMESYNRRDFTALGITDDFCQDNHSKSVKNTLRRSALSDGARAGQACESDSWCSA